MYFFIVITPHIISLQLSNRFLVGPHGEKMIENRKRSERYWNGYHDDEYLEENPGIDGFDVA